MKNKHPVMTAAVCFAVLTMASCGQSGTAAGTTTASETTATTAETAAAQSEETTTAATTASEAETEVPADDGDPDEGFFQPGAYAAVKDGEIRAFYIFEDATTGRTEMFDGRGGTPFTYEQTFDEVTFHFGSPDDTTIMKVHKDDYLYTVGTYEDLDIEYTFSYLETMPDNYVMPETPAVYPFTVPGVYAGVIGNEFAWFCIFDDESHGRMMNYGGTGETFTYELSEGRMVMTTEDGTEVPMTMRTDDYGRPVGKYESSGAGVMFSYIRGADPSVITLAEPQQSEAYEPAHPFRHTDTGWEMEDATNTLMDMNAVAGHNNAFMLQLNKNAVQNGFESHFIFLDSEGLIIADHKVAENSVADLGIAPAPMLSAPDIVVFPVRLQDIIDTYDIDVRDVASFYIAEDPENPCIELVTIEQY